MSAQLANAPYITSFQCNLLATYVCNLAFPRDDLKTTGLKEIWSVWGGGEVASVARSPSLLHARDSRLVTTLA